MKIPGSVPSLNGMLLTVVETNCDVVRMFRMKIKAHDPTFCLTYVSDKHKVNVLVVTVEGKTNVETDRGIIIWQKANNAIVHTLVPPFNSDSSHV